MAIRRDRVQPQRSVHRPVARGVRGILPVRGRIPYRVAAAGRRRARGRCANIGPVTVPLARAVGPAGRVYADEPQRLVFQLLCAEPGVELELGNVVAQPRALGAQSGTTRVPAIPASQAHNFGGVALSADAADGEPVAVERIDDLGLAACRLVKVDVEGMEAEVLAGARETIARLRPLLYLENDRAEHSRALIELVRSLGYRAFSAPAAAFQPRQLRRPNGEPVRQHRLGQHVLRARGVRPAPRRLDGGRGARRHLVGQTGVPWGDPRRLDALTTLATLAGTRLKARGLKLATAESCTGGWVAQAVTSISGSSDWFERGFVTYSNEAKKELLGVRAATLARRRGQRGDRARDGARRAQAQPRADRGAVPASPGPAGGTRRNRWHGVLRLGAAGGAPKRRRGASRATASEVRRHSVVFALQGLLERDWRMRR